MSSTLRAPPVDVPTLTEVVCPSDLPATVAAVEWVDPSFDEERLVRQIAGDVQARADALLQMTLRERLPPLLAQLVDELLNSLVRDVREQCATELHDAVQRAVSDALAGSRFR